MDNTRPIQLPVLKGIDQRWTSRAPAANVVQDMYWDTRGAWASSGGYRRIILGPAAEGGGNTNPFAASGAIESIHWFSQHTGARRWLIYIDGAGALKVFNPSTAARTGSSGDTATLRDTTAVSRTLVTTPWQRHQSVCWGDTLYLVNGIDRALVFNGYFWDVAGWAQPAGSPSPVMMAHPHATDQGTPDATKLSNAGIGPTSGTSGTNYRIARRYRMSFVNDRGQESPLSEPSAIISGTNEGGTGISNGAHFVKVAIPIGPPETVARRLYATQNLYDSSGTLVEGRMEQFFAHSEIQDNVTVTLMDGKSDGFLGSAVDPDQLGEWPSDARFLASFKGCMFIATGSASEVRFSRVANPEVFPPDNVIPIPDGHLGPVTAIYATRNALVVFKAKGVYLVKGDPTNGFHAEPLTRSAGCIAPNTVRDVPGTGLVFLGETGLWALQGTLENEGVATGVVPMMVPLPDTVRRLNRSALINACGAAYHRDREYWLCVPTVGYANNNLVCVWHWDIREWSYRENFPVASILETPDHHGHLYFASYADTSGHSPDGVAHLGIMRYSRGFPDKDGTAIEPLYQTGAISAGNAVRSMRPRHVIANCILHGNNALVVDVNTNRSQASWVPAGISHDQQYPQDRSPVYGTATFDTTGILWQSPRDGAVRYDIDNPGAGPVFDAMIKLRPETGKRHMTLLGLSLEIPMDDPQATKPIKPDGA